MVHSMADYWVLSMVEDLVQLKADLTVNCLDDRSVVLTGCCLVVSMVDKLVERLVVWLVEEMVA